MNAICKKALALKEKAEATIRKNEYNTVRFCGVASVSRADLETVVLYCQTIATYGGYTGELMKPRGTVAEVLSKNGLVEG